MTKLTTLSIGCVNTLQGIKPSLHLDPTSWVIGDPFNGVFHRRFPPLLPLLTNTSVDATCFSFSSSETMKNLTATFAHLEWTRSPIQGCCSMYELHLCDTEYRIFLPLVWALCISNLSSEEQGPLSPMWCRYLLSCLVSPWGIPFSHLRIGCWRFICLTFKN